jgi:enamine deaminase RidA (YjgF/YER057c/UK114 family)
MAKFLIKRLTKLDPHSSVCLNGKIDLAISKFSQDKDVNMVQRFDVGTRLSEMAIHNGVVYLAGQIPEDPNLGIEGQTREVLEAIDRLLARAGTDKSKLLMVQIFLVDLADFEGMNRVWDAWVVPGHTPPRATVQANLASSKWRIEVVATAAL